jgi:hypothetical protein
LARLRSLINRTDTPTKRSGVVMDSGSAAGSRVCLGQVAVSLKYATVERERRFLVSSIPEGVTRSMKIFDRYVIGSRLRLREVEEVDGTIVRKLWQKIRISAEPEEIACTNLNLDNAKWRSAVQAAIASPPEDPPHPAPRWHRRRGR